MIIINGEAYKNTGTGNICITDANLSINGKTVKKVKGVVRIEIKGELALLETNAPVVVKGDVWGDINGAGSVGCGDVFGDIQADGSVACDDVSGDVTAGGPVNCEDVGGDVSAGGPVMQG